ncbi:bestrophin family ion channel [Synechococcus sp. C9]|uniref:bestrophin family protein n=1 Tax=Synechococcus sp. C9 TaxID=102119 RepID=UPI001FF1C546
MGNRTHHWFRLAVQLRGSVLPRIAPRIVLFMGYSALIVFSRQMGWKLPISILGELTSNVAYNLVLGLLLVFRTNNSYDRYWEGRKAWGQIVISLRNLARTMQVSIPVQNEQEWQQKKRAFQLLIAFPIAVKLHLRENPDNQELTDFLTPAERATLDQVPNRPIYITLWLQDYFQKQVAHQRLDSNRAWELDDSVNQLIQGLATCERIVSTPLPMAYVIYLKQLILVYCLALPWGLKPELGWAMVLIVGVVAFILMGVEELAREIENPFGLDVNDLPLEDLCTMIRRSVNMISQFQPPVFPAADDR